LKKNPDDKWLKEFDKGKKLKFAAAYAMTIGANYIMTVDSDDCISNRICEFVSKNNDSSILGWYVKKEYLYRDRCRVLFNF
jgi:NAD-dependent dihydropyrimidine dehydrogenase PreA subunit